MCEMTQPEALAEIQHQSREACRACHTIARLKATTPGEANQLKGVTLAKVGRPVFQDGGLVDGASQGITWSYHQCLKCGGLWVHQDDGTIGFRDSNLWPLTEANPTAVWSMTID